MRRAADLPRRGGRVAACCGQIIPAGQRCGCAIKNRAQRDSARPTARQRGYDGEWQAAAAAFLAEPQNRFCACGAPAVVVMHVKSIRLRPDLRMDRRNWRPGCKRCNAIDAAREKRAKQELRSW